MNTPPPVTTIEEMKKRVNEFVERAPSGARVVNCYPETIEAIIEQTYHLAQDQRTAEIREMIWQMREDYRNDGFVQHISTYDALLTSLGNKSV